MNIAQYTQVVSAVKQAAAAKQAADAQFAAVINHPATQTAVAFEKQAAEAEKANAAGKNGLSPQVIDALIGGGLGAALGGGAGALLADDETRLRNALIGALLGGTAGGAGGYFGGGAVRNLLGLGSANAAPLLSFHLTEPQARYDEAMRQQAKYNEALIPYNNVNANIMALSKSLQDQADLYNKTLGLFGGNPYLDKSIRATENAIKEQKIKRDELASLMNLRLLDLYSNNANNNALENKSLEDIFYGK